MPTKLESASVTNNSNYTTTLFHETENLVSVENNQVVTSSLQVAEYFGKRHANILRDIQVLISLNSKLSSGYVSTTYIDSNGKSQPMYIMTRDGFTLLAMGFTGKKAMQFKIAYIEAFNRMEELLKNKQAAQSDKSPKAIEKESSSKVKKLEEEIEWLEKQLRATKAVLKQEIDIKCSCFSYLVETKQYHKWEDFNREESRLNRQLKRAKELIGE